MTQGRGWAQVLADGIMGYVKGTQYNDEKAKSDAQLKMQQDSHDILMRNDAQAQDLQRNLQSAAQPVDVVQGAGGVTLPASADNRDVGQPDGPSIASGGLTAGYRVGDTPYATSDAATAAATAANSPDAIQARQVAAYRAAGKPMEATQLETSGLQGQQAKFTLDKETDQWAREKLGQEFRKIGAPTDAAPVLSKITGQSIEAIPSADGKTTQFVRTMPDGTKQQFGTPVDNTQDGLLKLWNQYGPDLSSAQVIAGLQHQQQFGETVRHNTSTEGMTQQQITEAGRHNKAEEGIGMAHVGIAREGLSLQGRGLDLQQQKLDLDKKYNPEYAMSPKLRMAVQQQGEIVKGIDQAINTAMTNQTWDPMSPNGLSLLAKRTQAAKEFNRLLGPQGDTGKPSYQEAIGGAPTGPASQGVTGIASAPPGSVVNAGNGQWAAPGTQTATTASTAQPTAVSAATTQAPAPSAAPMPPSDPVLAALNPSGNASLNSVAEPKAATIRQAAAALRQAQAQVVTAAQAGNQQAVTQATQSAQAAINALDKETADMDPGMAKRVRAALGL